MYMYACYILVVVYEVGVLEICQIVKRVDALLIHGLSVLLQVSSLLFVLIDKVEAQ